MTEHASVRDTLVMGNHVWAVTGVFLGGSNEESVLGLQVVGIHDAAAYGRDIPELFVPEILIRSAIQNGLLQLHKSPS